MTKKLTNLLIFALSTRILILTIPWLANTLMLPDVTHLDLFTFIQNSWSRWDAPHYIFLALNGYVNTGDEANFIVFFPLYPLLLKPLIFLYGNPVFSSLALSISSFILGLYFFYKLVLIDYPEEVATMSLISVAIFPTSYFFNTPYTEGLFFLTFALSMYFARKGEWAYSGIFAGFGTITRPFGFLILAAILIEWLYDKAKTIKSLPIIVIPTVLSGFSYLYLNYKVYGDMFMFRKILSEHWQKQPTSPFKSILDSWHIAFGGSLNNFGVMVGWAEAVTITISWLLIPVAFKYLRRSMAVFYTLSIILFSSTNFILSTPRYFLSIPPMFILLALAQKNYLFKLIWSFTSVALLISLSILYTSGQWAF